MVRTQQENVRGFRWRTDTIGSIWDANTEKRWIQLVSAPLDAIKRIGGSPILNTAKEVSESDLDGNGHYPK